METLIDVTKKIVATGSAQRFINAICSTFDLRRNDTRILVSFGYHIHLYGLNYIRYALLLYCVKRFRV